MTPVPADGQLVEVRGRRYVVEGDPRRGSLGAGVADALRDHDPQHLVTLSSIEDDGRDEQLQVVWELEPGASVLEQRKLPEVDGLDPPERLSAFLDAVRWGAISTTDERTLHAPFRSGVDLEDYQLDPVVRALQMPRVNLLVADDVGLGKTIEAGLVVQELLLRHRARTVLVVCPAGLQIQWRDQMRDKFGLDFRIVDGDLVKRLRRTRGLHFNPWRHFPRLITSIDFLKRDRPMRLFRKLLPPTGEPAFPRRLDLLIVDEAHNAAPPHRAGAAKSLRTRAIEAIAPHFEHRLFLTATPHDGYPESFQGLLALLDDQRFHRDVPPDRAALERTMIRRLKDDFKTWDNQRKFAERRIIAHELRWSDEERAAHYDLREYTRRRIDGARDTTERYAAEFVLKLLKKRFFSSPAALQSSLETHRKTLERARRTSARAEPRPSDSVLRRRIDALDEDYDDDARYAEGTTDAIETASLLFRPLDADEEVLLSQLEDYAARATDRQDTKARHLVDWLATLADTEPDRRVIVFTEYRDTQKWLIDQLDARGLTEGDRLMCIYGGLHPDEREKIKAAFQAEPAVSPVRILLATDAASEGIDLQNHCADLVHYEIPWNPNRMEQRNGRIDRHGQRSPEVRIHHYVGEGYQQVRPLVASGAHIDVGELDGDLEFLMRAVDKMARISRDLLGKVGPVVAGQVEDAMLGRRTTLDTDREERESGAMRDLLKVERALRDTLTRCRAQLDETRRLLQLSPEHLRAVVDIGLELARQPSLSPLPPEERPADLDVLAWRVPDLAGSWAHCTEGLHHPHTHARRPIVFDHNAASGRDDVVLCHLGHRLVQRSLRLLRAEVWATAGKRKLKRAAADIIEDGYVDAPVVLVHARLVMLGADQSRLSEELMVAGGRIVDGVFEPLKAAEADAIARLSSLGAVDDAMSSRIVSLWPDVKSGLEAALNRRQADRARSLRSELTKLCDREKTRITERLEEFRAQLIRAVDGVDGVQQALPMAMDAAEERVQRHADTLRRRIDDLPGEIVRETAAIDARFAELTPHTFPVAVTFRLPRRFTR